MFILLPNKDVQMAFTDAFGTISAPLHFSICLPMIGTAHAGIGNGTLYLSTYHGLILLDVIFTRTPSSRPLLLDVVSVRSSHFVRVASCE